jgi:uncharacterized membrane protein (UPF0127 family)
LVEIGDVALPRRLRHLPRTNVVGREVPVASTRRARLLGLAGLPAQRAGIGLLLPRCRSVHTFGMRFSLDVLFLDDSGAVVAERLAVSPRRIVRCRDAAAALELPAGSVRRR